MPHGIAGSRFAEFRGWTSSRKRASEFKKKTNKQKKSKKKKKIQQSFLSVLRRAPEMATCLLFTRQRCRRARTPAAGGCVRLSGRPRGGRLAKGPGMSARGDAVCGECPFLCLVGSGKVLHPGFTHLPSLPEPLLNPIKTPSKRGFSSPGTAGGGPGRQARGGLGASTCSSCTNNQARAQRAPKGRPGLGHETHRGGDVD